MSFSLAAGTKLKFEDPFSDIFAGIGIGHVLSTTALVVGVNFRTPRDAADTLLKEKRRGRFCVGLTFVF
jgi:hypothetical protein